MVDAPKFDVYHWLSIKKKVNLFNPNTHYYTTGMIENFSEVGATIKVENNQFFPNQIIKVKFPKENIILAAVIKEINGNRLGTKIKLRFHDLSLREERQLIAILYGNSDQWQMKQTPGELKSFWLMFKVLVAPKFLRKQQELL